MSLCTPCPPCNTEYPLLCEPLETTVYGKRLVVEDSAACQKTIQTPASQQALKTDGDGNLTWTNGSNVNILKKSSTGNVEFGKVETDYIEDDAITTPKIADNAITTEKIIDNAIVASKIPDKTITNAKFRDSIGLSVVGRSANTTGQVADIVAAADGAFLKRNGTALEFSKITSYDLPAKTLLNSVFVESNTEYTITNVIPFDNTIPQITEGTQIISATITPTKSTSRIVGIVSVNGDASATTVKTVLAAFRGASANSIAATWVKYISYASLISFEFTDLPNTTSEITYSIRVGPDADTLYINRSSTGALLGTANKITLMLLEINPA